MLVLSRKKDEKIIIGDDIILTIVEIDNNKIRIGIDAPDDVEIHREEVYREIESENKDALQVNQEIDLGNITGFNKQE